MNACLGSFYLVIVLLEKENSMKCNAYFALVAEEETEQRGLHIII